MAKESSKSKAVQADTGIDEPRRLVLSKEQEEQFRVIVSRICKARSQREQALDIFDGMSFEQAYLANRRASHSYLQPKRSQDEVRIVTGTTEKRIELVLNELLSMNWSSELRAHDKHDGVLHDVGSVLTDVVRRTNQVERLEDKMQYIYTELLTQPIVFLEELHVPQPNGRPPKFDRTLTSGVQVYLGDITLPEYMSNSQPYIVKYWRGDKSLADTIFGKINPERWQYVKAGQYSTIGNAPSDDLYRKGALKENEVEAFWYMSYPDNELQLIVGGIPQFDVGAKYTGHFGDLSGYHIQYFNLKPVDADSAYGKPLTQSAKTLQALDNETIRSLIRKFRQALEPPSGIVGGRMLSRDIWNPGSFTQGVRKGDIERLIDHQGVTQSEIAMFDIIEKKTNEFVGSMQQAPLQGKTQVTATEFRLAQQQAVKLLGLSVLAAMRIEERMSLLRAENILWRYSKPVGKKVDPISGAVADIYARFTIPDSNVEDMNGEHVVQFMGREITDEERMAIFNAEEKAKKAKRPFKMSTLNVKSLEDVGASFYAVAVSRPKESSEIEKMDFTDMLRQGVAISNITGRRLKSNKLIDKFERLYRESDMFEKDEAQMMNALGVNGNQAPDAVGRPGMPEGMEEAGAMGSLTPSNNA